MNAKRLAIVVCIVVCGAGQVLGQTVWQQNPGNPIIGPGDPGTWDQWGHYIASVVFHGSTYHMWYTSITPEGRATDIGHATSPDGVVWAMDPGNPVITRGAPGEWNENYLFGAAVIHDGTRFRMWYEGEDADGISRAGYATSPDGSVWTEYPDNPVMDAGPPESWDTRGVSPRTVIADSNGYRMWYTAYGEAPVAGTRVFVAESADGITWIKHGPPVLDHSEAGWDSAWVSNPTVIFDEPTYHMWYAGRDVAEADFEDGSAIGYASSSDGLVWTRYDDNPVVEASTGYTSTASVVFDGSIYRMWYSYWDGELVDWVGLASSAGDMNHKRFIPAAAVASGAQGAFFQTDVDVNNAGGEPADYSFMWLPRGRDNSEPTVSETFNLGPGMSVRYDNVLNSVFGLEPNSLGALAIVASSPDLLAMSRTYNAPTVKVAGTYGQAMPAISASQFIQTGERRRILFASEDSDLRTNIGCQNGGDFSIVVNLELFDADGTSLETIEMDLSPYSNDQYNRVFEDFQPVNGCVEVWTTTVDGSFYCYGSVLDNVTSDPTTIPPQ